MHQVTKLLGFFLTGCITFFISSSSWAVPITVDQVMNYRDNRSVNSVGFSAGDKIVIGANIVTPNGSSGTTAVASLPGTGVTRNLPWRPFSIFPDQFSRSIPYNNDLRTGSWDLTFTNGSDVTTVSTLGIGDVSAVPFVNNMSLTNTSGNALTPTFNWSLPADSVDRVQIRIFDLDNRIITDQADQIFSQSLLHTAENFTLPEGVLETGGNYSVSIQLANLRDPAVPGHVLPLSRSRAFFDFQAIEGDVINPVYLPSVESSSGSPVYHFNVDVVGGQTIFIDPLIAIGYEYAIGLGDPNFASVILPFIGDDLFTLELFDAILNDWVHTADLTAGIEYFFGGLGVDRFRILGIETSAMLDPNDATAFITGLTFTGNGQFTGTMTPIAINVPEPATLALLVLGLAGMGCKRRKVIS